MLATVIRLFVKVGLESITTVDVSRKIDVLMNVCRYGALFTSAVSFGACVSSLQSMLQSNVKSHKNYYREKLVVELICAILALVIYSVVVHFLGNPAVEPLPSF